MLDTQAMDKELVSRKGSMGMTITKKPGEAVEIGLAKTEDDPVQPRADFSQLQNYKLKAGQWWDKMRIKKSLSSR